MAGCSHRASPVVGIDVPLAGPDGARGILALQAVRLALDERTSDYSPRLEVRDASGGGFADPHEDEGAGDWRNPGFAAKNVRSLASNGSVVAVIGGFNDAIASAETQAARHERVPLLLANRTQLWKLNASRQRRFEGAYRRRYREAPDATAARYYAIMSRTLDCRAASRDELAHCL